MIYSLTGQVAAVVPYEVRPGGSTIAQVEYQGRLSNPLTLSTAAAAPALFTTDSSGKGQGAILNQDGSANGPTNPAAKGSIVVLFGTGEGLITHTFDSAAPNQNPEWDN